VGTAHGHGDYVLFLNNDVLSAPGAPSRLAEALEQDPQAVAAGGALVDPGTRHVQARYQPRRFPGAVALLVRLLGIERLWPANPWTGQHLTAPLDQSRRQRTARQLAGACLMVRRSALGSVGGWDERYWMFYEDVDLLRRLVAIGPAVYVPDAIFEHLGGASTAAWRKPELHLRLYHGTLVYAQAHLTRAEQVVVGLAMLAACLVRAGAYWVAGNPIAARIYRDLARSAAAAATLRPVPEQVSVRREVRR
jgi:N-acetylglucosaminyl-diphospho-decaprenol L-rhamnosyltransferase